MQVMHHIDALRASLTGQQRTAFVPTMGNLHEGHLSLVRLARERGAPVVVSIFVNRLQFAPHEDFDQYPRTLQRDCELLDAAGCDFVFAPNEREMYPQPQGYTVAPPPALTDILEGHFRPGFFTGVCTVVLKLFNIVQPAVSVFGKKDYQQLMVIRNMVRAVRIADRRGGRRDDTRSPTRLRCRRATRYLSAAQRSEAVRLSRLLQQVAAAIRDGRRDWQALEADAMRALHTHGWQPDYVAVRRRADLGEPTRRRRRWSCSAPRAWAARG